ncbi:hypothetical protein ES703_59035 [subsurface metagenome]
MIPPTFRPEQRRPQLHLGVKNHVFRFVCQAQLVGIPGEQLGDKVVSHKVDVGQRRLQPLPMLNVHNEVRHQDALEYRRHPPWAEAALAFRRRLHDFLRPGQFFLSYQGFLRLQSVLGGGHSCPGTANRRISSGEPETGIGSTDKHGAHTVAGGIKPGDSGGTFGVNRTYTVSGVAMHAAVGTRAPKHPPPPLRVLME